MSLSTRLVAIAVAGLAVACVSEQSTPRIRVARDLGCTADATAVRRLSEHRWEVTGCGRTAIYVCTYPVRDCWREGAVRASEDEGPQSAVISGR